MEIKNEHNFEMTCFLKSLNAFDRGEKIGIQLVTIKKHDKPLEYGGGILHVGKLVIDIDHALSLTERKLYIECRDLIDYYYGCHHTKNFLKY